MNGGKAIKARGKKRERESKRSKCAHRAIVAPKITDLEGKGDV